MTFLACEALDLSLNVSEARLDSFKGVSLHLSTERSPGSTETVLLSQTVFRGASIRGQEAGAVVYKGDLTRDTKK